MAQRNPGFLCSLHPGYIGMRYRKETMVPHKARKTKSQAAQITATKPVPRGASASKRTSAESLLKELKRRLLEIDDLSAAASVLNWDQATYMPAGGARARARQNATLHRLAHERLIDPA